MRGLPKVVAELAPVTQGGGGGNPAPSVENEQNDELVSAGLVIGSVL
jgi:hypothetical protein